MQLANWRRPNFIPRETRNYSRTTQELQHAFPVPNFDDFFHCEFSALQLEDKYETVRVELFSCKSQLSETEEEKARLELENHQVRFAR